MQFDQIHPATSVLNRIMNLRDELRASRPAKAPQAAPQAAAQASTQDPLVPDTAIEGQALDAALQQPAQGASGPVADDMLAGAVADAVI